MWEPRRGGGTEALAAFILDNKKCLGFRRSERKVREVFWAQNT